MQMPDSANNADDSQVSRAMMSSSVGGSANEPVSELSQPILTSQMPAHGFGQAMDMPAKTKVRKQNASGGVHGKKRRKKVKDPEAPKNPLSAYLFFVVKQRSEMSPSDSELDFREMAKKIGRMWRGMSKEEKQPYVQLADYDKKRYEKEKQQYREKLNDAKNAKAMAMSSMPMNPYDLQAAYRQAIPQYPQQGPSSYDGQPSRYPMNYQMQQMGPPYGYTGQDQYPSMYSSHSRGQAYGGFPNQPRYDVVDPSSMNDHHFQNRRGELKGNNILYGGRGQVSWSHTDSVPSINISFYQMGLIPSQPADRTSPTGPASFTQQQYNLKAPSPQMPRTQQQQRQFYMSHQTSPSTYRNQAYHQGSFREPVQPQHTIPGSMMASSSMHGQPSLRASTGPGVGASGPAKQGDFNYATDLASQYAARSQLHGMSQGPSIDTKSNVGPRMHEAPSNATPSGVAMAALVSDHANDQT